MGLVDYISWKTLAKTKKISSYNKNFEVATVSKTTQPVKHIIRNLSLVLLKT